MRRSGAAACLVLALAAGVASADEPRPDPEPWQGWHTWFVGHDTWTAPSGHVVLDRWTVAWPLFQFGYDPVRDERHWYTPWPLVGGVWGPEYTHFRVAPFLGYWRWREQRVLVAVPLGIGEWHDDHWTVVLPFFFGQHDSTSLRWTLFPVAWWFDEADGGRLRSVWPLFHYRSRPDGRRHLDLLPATLLPVGAWRADYAGDDVYVGLLWPLLFGYRAKGDAWSTRFLFEGLVLWSDRTGHFGWRILGGLFSYESDDRGYLRWSIFWGVFTREIRDRTRPHPQAPAQ